MNVISIPKSSYPPSLIERSGFTLAGSYQVEPYEGTMNPTQWLQAYATAVHAARGDTSVMANYLPVMLTPAAMS